MNISDIIFAQPISAIWKALGGDTPRRGRARAFYRDGDNPGAVSMNDEKCCWHDFVTGEGGGVLDLIQRILGCDRASAVHWLSGFTGMPLDNWPLTTGERRQFAHRQEHAKQLARDVADFERGLELALLRRRDNAADIALGLMEEDAEATHVLISANRDLAVLYQADADSLVQTYQSVAPSVQRALVESGRKDREHAEKITRTIIETLALSESSAAENLR